MFRNVLQNEIYFVIDTLAYFPQLFEPFSKTKFSKKLQIIQELLSELEKPSIKNIPTKRPGDCVQYLENQ